MRFVEAGTLVAIRRALLVIFVLGAVGTGLELMLLGHTEDAWQWAPLVLLFASLGALIWRSAGGGAASLRVFQGVMVLCLLAGLLGLGLHFQGNVEFELEMYPSLRGFSLFWESLTGATPALAPGTMVGLGLLGLAYTYRHPALVERH